MKEQFEEQGMKKKVNAFGHVFRSGKKYFYCYQDSNDLNQHSIGFDNVEDCSQEFAQKFAEWIVKIMNQSITED